MTATRWLRPEPVRDRRRAAAVALLPILILGLLLAALWNPQDRLATVPAAIVNLDEPVTIDGQLVPLGRQLAAGLVSGGETPEEGESAAVPASDDSYDWQVADEETAREGLADGTYAAVVTIPEGFSEAATSFGSDDPSDAEKATIDVATAPDGRVLDDALAQIVAQTATGIMGDTLTETYVDNVLVGFSTLSENLSEAADGADQLADGASDAGKGATKLADGAQEASAGIADLGDGASQLAGGAGELAGGVGQWAGGAGTWAAGASQWAAGADRASAGITQLAGGAGRLSGGAGDLSAGAGELAGLAQMAADGNRDLANRVARTNTEIAGFAGKTQKSIAEMEQFGEDMKGITAALEVVCKNPALLAASTDLQGVCADLATLKPPSSGSVDVSAKFAELTGDMEAFVGGTEDLARLSQGVATGVSGLSVGAEKLAGGAGKVEQGANSAAAGVSALAGGARELAAGAGGLAGGATQLSSGAGSIADGASGLADGAGKAADGTKQIADGVGDLAGGIDELAGGAGELSDGLGQATEELPSYSEGERESLASVVSDPVEVSDALELGTGASGPMFAVLALWLGALGTMLVFPPVPFGARGSTRSPVRQALGALALPAGIAVGTGAVTGAVLAAVEGLDAGGWAAAIGVGVLVSVAFVAVNQGLAAALGHAGRGVSLLVAVLVIAAGVVSTAPAALRSVGASLPSGAAQEALSAVTESTGSPAAACVGLVVWALAGVATTMLVVARSRTVRAAELRPV